MNMREWALPIYTIMMQLATGTLFVLWIIRSLNIGKLGGAAMDKILCKPIMVVFFSIIIATIGSHFHLSNPLLSFLAVLNLRSSWLSREVVFTIFIVLVCAALVDQVWLHGGKRQRLKTVLGWGTVLLGAASIYCMSSIYLIPTQAPWNHWSTILIFYCSGFLLGTTSATALLVMDAIFSQEHEPGLIKNRLVILKQSAGWMAWMAILTVIIVVFLNVVQFMAGSNHELAMTSLTLLTELYKPLLGVRFFVLFTSAGIFTLAADWLSKKDKSLSELVAPVYMACLLALVSEILGRFLFYASHVRIGI